MGAIGGLFGDDETTSSSESKTTVTPFRDTDDLKALTHYNDYYDSVVNQSKNVQEGTNSAIKKVNSGYDTALGGFGKTLDNMNNYINKAQNQKADYIKFNQAWKGLSGVDMSNLNKMNTQSLNPYEDEVTKNYIDASNKAAYLANGQNVNQMMQNMIGSNMANSSGHQTAAAKVGAQLAANINAQNQATYMARQNQLEQNALAANGQLTDFYNKLSNLGLDYAKLTQQDLSTMLQAYQQSANMYSDFGNMLNGYATGLGNLYGVQGDALKQVGAAVSMASNPETHMEGTNTQEGGGSGLFGTAANIAAAYYGAR